MRDPAAINMAMQESLQHTSDSYIKHYQFSEVNRKQNELDLHSRKWKYCMDTLSSG